MKKISLKIFLGRPYTWSLSSTPVSFFHPFRQNPQKPSDPMDVDHHAASCERHGSRCFSPTEKNEDPSLTPPGGGGFFGRVSSL